MLCKCITVRIENSETVCVKKRSRGGVSQSFLSDLECENVELGKALPLKKPHIEKFGRFDMNLHHNTIKR